MTRITSVIACAAVLAASTQARAGDKENAYAEMRALDRAIQELRNNNAPDAQIRVLSGRYQALQERLGGDDPANMFEDVGAMPAIDPTLASQPQAITAPVCPGIDLAPPVVFPGQPGPIVDVATQTFQCPVGGVDEFLWDVDVRVFIQHTFAGDLDISLRSPTGTTVTLTTDNGAGNDDVFNGTLWDDNANDPTTDHIYANLVPATPLSPEGRLAAFRGEDANGIWQLIIADDAAGDVGNVNQWFLEVTTTSTPEGSTSTTFMRTPGLPIIDLNTTSDVMPVAGLGSTLEGVVLYVEIMHTFAGDLDMRLVSPAGTMVTIGTDNGAGNDNVYNGTVFDPDVLDTVTDHIYANLVVATPLSPEGSFDNFVGENPNGLWRIDVADDANADVGVLVRWDLTLRTCAPALPVSYCTAGPTTSGCFPEISASANPSVTFANPCIITATNVEGAKTGLIFYGVSGPVMLAWNASSFLCVKAPTQRTPAQNTGGTAGTCQGVLVLDWNLYQQNNPTALGNPWQPGAKAWCQGWFRDPPAGKTTNLTDAVELTYTP